MADTAAALPPEPEMAAMPEPAGMTISAAMDILDKYHIKRSDYDEVLQALEMIFEPGEPLLDEGDEGGDEAAMAAEMFAPGRDRKAI